MISYNQVFPEMERQLSAARKLKMNMKCVKHSLQFGRFVKWRSEGNLKQPERLFRKCFHRMTVQPINRLKQNQWKKKTQMADRYLIFNDYRLSLNHY